MNDLIERYIFDVTRRLPEKEREDVGRELNASISDMLPDDPKERDIVDTLTRLGEPRVLSEQYRQKPRYLISPAMFELYISVLKMVVVIVAVVFACLGALTAAFPGAGSVGETISAVMASAFGSAFEGALQAAFWVTFGFAVTEFYQSKQQPWSVDKLPRLPDRSGVRIPRSSTIVEMILSVFFTVLFIAMILRDEWFFSFVRRSEIINPFSQAALERCVPFLVIFGALSLITDGLKLYWARWNIPLCIVNAAHHIIQVSIAINILHWPDLFSFEFIEFTAALTGDIDILRHISSGGAAAFFSIVFIAIAAIDIGVSVWNTSKGTREDKVRIPTGI